MNICVFCSMYDTDEKYGQAASELGKGIALGGHSLVWGCSDMGLMKTIADAVQEHGGKTIGITTEHLKDKARKSTDELIVTKNLAERKALMNERSDAFLLLPGGIGSFDEITDMLELKKHRVHDKPIVILNVDGFYDGFHSQLEHMAREGFIARPLEEYVRFVETSDEAMRIVNGQ